METREMLSDHLTAVGVHQYKKSFWNHVKQKPLENMHHLKQQNLPQRKFKKRGGLPLVMGQKEVDFFYKLLSNKNLKITNLFRFYVP
jgi:hypothetical protein